MSALRRIESLLLSTSEEVLNLNDALNCHIDSSNSQFQEIKDKFASLITVKAQTSSALTSVQDVFTQTQLIKSEIEINNKAFVNKSNSLWDKLNAVSNEIKSVNLKSSHVNVLTETYISEGKLDCVDVIVVHVGTNNVSDGDSVHAIIDDYRNLICTVRQSLPRTELVISSILPRPTHYQANRTIYDVNNRLFSLEEQHVEILDNTLDFLYGDQPNLTLFADHVHTNVAGAKVLSHSIISCVNTLLNLSDCTSETQSNFQSVRSTGRRFIPFNTTTQQQNVFRQTYWRSKSLVLDMFKQVSDPDEPELCRASHRSVLSVFGGTIKYDEFKKRFTTKKYYMQRALLLKPFQHEYAVVKNGHRTSKSKIEDAVSKALDDDDISGIVFTGIVTCLDSYYDEKQHLRQLKKALLRMRRKGKIVS
ncbi:unnamed protein product [Mytilus coruscus]|uniref:SGNH hydrolase-type esterase domain-containing protein n=1 Tax=Mytilus coruscus TaxID=42192 RepID=A0A6J8ACT7_MYTCO|nr:unnamed protein product [Mytilus coruscus]